MSHRILLCALASLSLLASCSPAPEPAPDEERGAWGPRGAPSSRGLASSAFLAPGYCFSSGGSTTYEYIQDISFTQNANATLTILVDIFITNPSGCTAGNPCPVYDDSPEYVNVWIDWNDDGSWSSSEQVLDLALTGYTSINYAGIMSAAGTVAIPASTVALPWARVNLGWDYDPSGPCTSSWTWGDVEDEIVIVDLPYIESVAVTPTNPETTKDVTLTATIHEVDGFTIDNIHWAGDVAPAGSGNPAYTYKPVAGAHGKDKAIEATMTFSNPAVAVSGQDVWNSTFDLFFDKDGDEDGDGKDNWYEHWSQNTDSATSIDDGRNGGTYNYAGGPYGGNNFASYNGSTASPAINITNRTSMDCAYAFQLSLAGSPVYDFSTQGKGIDCVEETLGHEWQHYDTDVAWQTGGAWNGSADSDSDELPDSLENSATFSGMGFSATNANSFSAAGFPYGDDEEVYCEIQGYGLSGTSANDWANPGKQTTPAYKAVTTGSFSLAEFTGLATDYGVDDDSDTLFDWLALDVEVDVFDAGDYYLYGSAWDADGNLVWAEADYVGLSPGVQDLTLYFDGPTLRNYGASGALEVFYLYVSGGSSYDVWPSSYFTAGYDWSEFDTTIAWFTDTYADSGVDTDADGSFDELQIDVEIQNDGSADDYELVGWLESPTGANLGASSVTQALSAGANTVSLTFSGDTIRLNGEDGPYSLTALDLTLDGDRIDFRPLAYDTAAYSVSDFDAGPASLVGTFTDSGVDLSADGLYDELQVDVDLTTTVAGVHFLWASLVDSTGTLIERVTAQADLGVGADSIALSFSGTTIVQHGVDGPWTLQDIDLFEPGGTLADSASGWTTQAWTVSQFGELVTLTGVTGELTPDDNTNTLYDSLDLQVEVVPQGNGLVFASGRLLAPSGTEIAWSTVNEPASTGVPVTLTLSFPGAEISGLGEDGPYELETLQVWHSLNPALLSTELSYYTTGAYAAGDFEAGATVVGTVYDDSWAPAPGVGLNIQGGDVDYTATDGSYTLVDSIGGALVIEIDDGAFAAPPRIFENGTLVAIGDTWTTTVPVGASAQLDFVFAPTDTTPPSIQANTPEAISYQGYEVLVVDVVATDSDSGVVSLTLDIDGTPYSVGDLLDMSSFSAGTHTMTAVATDFEGNTMTLTLTFNVIGLTDTTAPTVTVVEPSAGSYTTLHQVTLDVDIVDTESGVEIEEILLDGSPVADGDLLDMSILGIGTHTLTASATDYAGNTGSDSVTFDVSLPDSTAPVITISSPQATDYAYEDSVLIDVDVVDADSGVASIGIDIGGTPYLDGDSVVFADLGEGLHTLTVAADDVAGNSATDSVEFTILGPAGDDDDATGDDDDATGDDDDATGDDDDATGDDDDATGDDDDATGDDDDATGDDDDGGAGCFDCLASQSGSASSSSIVWLLLGAVALRRRRS